MSRIGRIVRALLRHMSAGVVESSETFHPSVRQARIVQRNERGHAPSKSKSSAAAVNYAPTLDGNADPGEIVWAWVPYEEDPAKGKDRPVLVIGRAADKLLALQLTSRDHDRDAAQEARHGRYWMDIGAGPWDRERRPSEVRLDRLLRLDERAVRREGAVLGREAFDEVVRRARNYHDI